jgi:hypothetical protein
MMMQRMATIVAFPLHHIKTPTMCCRVHWAETRSKRTGQHLSHCAIRFFWYYLRVSIWKYLYNEFVHLQRNSSIHITY